ncbi:MAG: terminase small subunit [Erysipelotrichia bacterium]|nr:terminase small subunit [Erysipelotrichia bacterium]
MNTNNNNNESAFMKLAPKRRNFVEYYFACEMNATQAAAKAGYSKRSARTQAEFLMKNPAVRAAIEEKRQEYARKNDVTPDWVVANAKKVVIRCMQEEPIYDKEGNPTGANTGSTPPAPSAPSESSPNSSAWKELPSNTSKPAASA